MFARLAWGKVKPGTWGQYEQLYHDEILPRTREVKGLRFRELLRGTDDPDEGISLTLWESREDLDAYERGDPMERREPWRSTCYPGAVADPHWLRYRPGTRRPADRSLEELRDEVRPHCPGRGFGRLDRREPPERGSPAVGPADRSRAGLS